VATGVDAAAGVDWEREECRC